MSDLQNYSCDPSEDPEMVPDDYGPWYHRNDVDKVVDEKDARIAKLEAADIQPGQVWSTIFGNRSVGIQRGDIWITGLGHRALILDANYAMTPPVYVAAVYIETANDKFVQVWHNAHAEDFATLCGMCSFADWYEGTIKCS